MERKMKKGNSVDVGFISGLGGQIIGPKTNAGIPIISVINKILTQVFN